jgi:trimeric autotransporter adhesin
VHSDAYFNTASGTDALINQTAGLTAPASNNNSAFGAEAMQSNTTGQWNTGIGSEALQFNTTGTANTGLGYNALNMNTFGEYNTGCGFATLQANTIGSYNTAHGSGALYSNTTGNNNTSSGFNALALNTSGSENTTVGYESLYSNTVGSFNTAHGYYSLFANTTGSYTTAVGSYSLQSNTTGGYNTGFGAYALNANTTGSGNTAFGYAGLRSTTTGSENIGFGYQSLYQNATGSNNIAMGYRGGYNLLHGSNNIEIGNVGVEADNDVIRIGTQGTQTTTYLAGVSDAKITGAAVYVTSSGQLGVLASSERYKTAIAPLGSDTEKLMQLRPVSFHLKTDPKGAVQYGLIAEEVDKVYPELVIRDDSGKVQGVRYDELAPMLLNEVQKQQRTIAAQNAHAAAQDAEIRDLKKMVAETQAGLVQLQSKRLVAQR